MEGGKPSSWLCLVRWLLWLPLLLLPLLVSGYRSWGAGSWSLLLSETLELLLIPHEQLEAVLEEITPEVVMDGSHLCPHPVGSRCPGVAFQPAASHPLFSPASLTPPSSWLWWPLPHLWMHPSSCTSSWGLVHMMCKRWSQFTGR